MYVKALYFKNFRNLSDGFIEPCENVNIIYGDNAQGKTNLLEALWLFCGGHSFKGSRESEFVKFGEKQARIRVEFFSQNREQNSELVFGSNRKEVYINGVQKKSAASLIERYNAVIFSPEDLTLVKRGPSARRRFIDSAICREKLGNALIISRYNQTLNQRNALLKDIYRHPELKNTLSIWDDTLCYLGSQIIVRRLEYIKKLKESAEKYHLGISGGREELSIGYLSTTKASYGENEREIFKSFSDNLRESQKEDIKSGFTTVGPHRDDFDIIINKKRAKSFASQGQQRSAVLSLKLAEAKVLSELTGENPVILLDDVMSELDRKRQDFLLNKVRQYQVFITCCDLDESLCDEKSRKFFIKEGSVS